MKWRDVRAAFPDQWVTVELLERHVAAGRQHWDAVVVVGIPEREDRGLAQCQALNQANLGRTYGCFHTSRPEVFTLAPDGWRDDPPAVTGIAMTWRAVRAAWPDRWVVVEVLESHHVDEIQYWDRVAVVDIVADGHVALKQANVMSRANPSRAYFPHHTSVEVANVEVVFQGPWKWWRHATHAAP